MKEYFIAIGLFVLGSNLNADEITTFTCNFNHSDQSAIWSETILKFSMKNQSIFQWQTLSTISNFASDIHEGSPTPSLNSDLSQHYEFIVDIFSDKRILFEFDIKNSVVFNQKVSSVGDDEDSTKQVLAAGQLAFECDLRQIPSKNR